jgi:NADPH:quinone reductase-like Zn-dependent oxidoreductase
MPTVCLTVIYSLRYRVNLRRGQTVLIHAATGGAGQICIQYCQWLGARVLATAGTEEKRRFLREQCGVEHVFNSRDASFANSVRTLLPNGVDVIINSLSGPLLKESVKLLAYHGHFVEWGKRDVFDRTQLSMFDFRSDCSFHVIDLISLSDKQQDICTVMLKEMVDLFVLGKLRAIHPTVVFEPSQVVEAFMRFVSGQAMGKSVVRMTNSDQPLYLTDKKLSKLVKGNYNLCKNKICKNELLIHQLNY